MGGLGAADVPQRAAPPAARGAPSERTATSRAYGDGGGSTNALKHAILRVPVRVHFFQAGEFTRINVCMLCASVCGAEGQQEEKITRSLRSPRPPSPDLS